MEFSAVSVPAIAVVQEFATVALGDARLHARLRRVVERLSACPGASLPQALKTDAEVEACYRLLNNRRVSYAALVQPHVEQTAKRVAEESLLRVLHDTTECTYAGEGDRRGLGPARGPDGTQSFFAHVSLAVTTDATPRPLGVLGLECWARTAPPRPKKKGHKKLSGTDYAHLHTKESARWARQVEAVEQQVGGRASLLHVMDREADVYSLLSALVEPGRRFVVRVAHDRKVWEVDEEDEPLDDEVPRFLSEALLESRLQLEREVPLSKRRSGTAPRQQRIHPDREARTARLEISARRVALRRPRYLSTEPETLEVNIVSVRELDVPEGLEPVAWVLVTSEPIATPKQLEAVVDHYRARWLIEEFFKALKTGCAVEARQLESFESLTNALALVLPIAWQMLLLRALSRTTPDAPAEEVLNPVQMALLRQVQPKKMPAQGATVRDALYAVAGLGGHLKHNGPPGWLTLARGLQELRLLELGWQAAASHLQGQNASASPSSTNQPREKGRKM